MVFRPCAQNGFASAQTWKKLAVAQHHRAMTDICQRFIARVRMDATEIQASPSENLCVHAPDLQSLNSHTHGAASSLPKWNSLPFARISVAKSRGSRAPPRTALEPHATIYNFVIPVRNQSRIANRK